MMALVRGVIAASIEADALGEQGKPEGVGAIAHPDTEFAVAEFRVFLLKLGDEFAAREGVFVDHGVHRRHDFLADGIVMGFEVEEGYFG